ncbi:MAG: ATP-binding protein [Cellulosilyticaceae bacterium]
MKELSLHILDIIENSIRAEATRIELTIEESIKKNTFRITIEDNGKGMNATMLRTAIDPFSTTRTLRKVGLGIPLLDQLCKECGGILTIESKEGIGTRIIAKMEYNHIDRLPLGEIEKTITTLIMAKPNIHYRYEHYFETQLFVFDTEEIKKILEGVSICDLEILHWLENYIREGIHDLN